MALYPDWGKLIKQEQNVHVRGGRDLTRIIHGKRSSRQEAPMNREFLARSREHTLQRAVLADNPRNAHGRWTTRQSGSKP